MSNFRSSTSLGSDAFIAGSAVAYVNGGPITYKGFSSTSAVFGAQGLCVATANATVTITLSLSTIAAALTGQAAAPGNIVFGIVPNNSLAALVLVPALTKTARSGFNNTSSVFPAAALLNANVTQLATDDAVPAWLTGGGAGEVRVGFLPLMAALRFRLRCFSLEVKHPTSGQGVTVTSRLRSTWSPLIAVNGVLTTISSPSDAVYPLVSPLVLTVRRDVACPTANATGGLWQSLALTLLGDSAVFLQSWGAVRLPDFASLRQYAALALALCPAHTRVASAGSSAIQNVLAAVAYRYPTNTTFLDYASGGSGAGVAGIKDRSLDLGATDAFFTAAELANYTTVRFTPAAAFGVVVTYNVPETVALVIPRCSLVALFNGTIRYWDDAALQDANPNIILPHTSVTVVVRSDRSGTVETFTQGLKLLDDECTPGGRGQFAMTATWNVTAANIVGASGTNGVVALHSATPWSVSFMAQDAAELNSLASARFSGRDGSLVAVSQEAVNYVLSRARINNATNEVTLDVTGAYPFVGITYFMFHRNHTGACARIKAALDLVLWTLTSVDARAIIYSQFFFPITNPAFVGLSLAALKDGTTCDGAPLFPINSTVVGDNGLAAIAGVSASVVVVAIAAAAVVLGCRGDARDVRCAPKDASSPVTIIFTDIQSSTALWGNLPHCMGPVLDAHHEIIRSVIAKHKAYEVKTVGDCFMIACKTAEQAAGVALDIQDALYDYEWGDAGREVDNMYEEMISEANTNMPGDAWKHGDLWRGLRVRIGVASGLVDIKYDEITKGYDYYGTAVNAAARVESVGHGGQVLLCENTHRALGSSGLEGLSVVSMGPQPLRGLPEPLGIFQVARPRFSRRWFPPLKIEKEDDGFDEGGSVASTRSQGVLGPNEQLVCRVITTLFSTMKPSDRDKHLNDVAKAWRVKIARTSTDSVGVRNLAVKVCQIHKTQDSKMGEPSRSGSLFPSDSTSVMDIHTQPSTMSPAQSYLATSTFDSGLDPVAKSA